MIINNIKSHQAALENQSFLHLRNVCKMGPQRSSTHSFLHSFQGGKTTAWESGYGESLFHSSYFLTEQELEARSSES